MLINLIKYLMTLTAGIIVGYFIFSQKVSSSSQINETQGVETQKQVALQPVEIIKPEIKAGESIDQETLTKLDNLIESQQQKIADLQAALEQQIAFNEQLKTKTSEIGEVKGLESLTMEDFEEKMKYVAKGMDGGPMGDIDYDFPLEEHKGRGYKVPNGGIYTTPNDLAKFMMSNLGYYRELLDGSNLSLMQTIQTPENKYWDNYGIGYFIYKHKERIYVGHSGSISGYSSYFLFDKESKYGVIILRNYNWGITELELRSIALLDKLNN